MKKYLALVIVVALGLGMVGCSAKTEGTGSAGANKDVALSTVVDAVKQAYGEDYLPSMLVEGEMLETTYGLTEDIYEEVYVEMPMISAQVDTFAAVKVKEGKQKEVLEALNKYRDYVVNDSLQYPMNALRLQSSRVIERDGFVFFVSLGVIPMELEKEDEIIAKAAELNDIAEKAIDSVLK